MKDVMIRDIIAADYAGWRRLWDGYLAFYHQDLPEAVTARTWARLLEPAGIFGRVAVRGDDVIGFYIAFTHPSTWVMGEDCYLEDLFVDPAARASGVGRALMADVEAVARAKGCARLYWHTDIDNTRARALYDSITPVGDVVRYRMEL